MAVDVGRGGPARASLLRRLRMGLLSCGIWKGGTDVAVIRKQVLPATVLALFSFGYALAQLPASRIDSLRFAALLRQQANASDRDLKLYSSKGVFAKILPNVRKGEVAAAGAVRIPVTIEFFLDRLRDIETFKKGPAILSIGKFSDPPQERNLATLSIQQKELDALAGCRPGKCGLKLSVDMMKRLRSGAATFGRGPKLESEFRTVLLEYVSAYITNGTPAMITYSDTDPPVHAPTEFLELLGQFSWLEKDAPQLVEALRNSLRTARPQLRGFLYWSKESLGLKPVLSVTQVLILKTTIEGKPWAFIASKQIYANHYFEASLGLTVLVEESADPAHAMVSVAYFNRSMTDGLRGWLASIERSIVERRVRSGMAKNLSEVKDKLGKAYLDRSR